MPRVPLPTTDEHGVGKEPSQAEVIRRTGVASASANAVLVTLAAGEDDRLNNKKDNDNNSPSPKGRRRILITNQSLPQHPQERHPTTTAAIGPTGGLSSWAQEGYRRVRSDQVQRKMHWLTGMAAIGGFLFGYDT